jgi:hypothetical protein
VDIYGLTIVPEPVAIGIAGFKAGLNDGRIRLEWRLEDPFEATVFRVHRRARGLEDVVVGEVQVEANRREYFYVDGDTRAGTMYEYSLEMVDRSGGSHWAGPLSVVTPPGSGLLWTSVYPNPFLGSIRLRLSTSLPEQVTARVYDVTGRETRILFDGVPPVGPSDFTWDGVDREGQAAPAGVYLVRARQGGKIATVRILKLR